MNANTELGLFLTTFASVFVAELGDKTQLATLALSGDAASTRSRILIFLGATLALTATSAIGVLAGGVLARLFSPSTIQRAAGCY